MSRRLLLLAASAGGAMLATGSWMTTCDCCDQPSGVSAIGGDRPAEDSDSERRERIAEAIQPPPLEPTRDPESINHQRAVEKARDFDSSFSDDVVVIDEQMSLLRAVRERLERAQRVVGHGHFGLFGMDDLRTAGRRFSKIGEFRRAEWEFLEELFDVEAATYGFFGDKVIKELSYRHRRTATHRVRGTGQHLLRGPSLEVFERLRDDVPSLVLTSGVRGLAKQYQLFLSKVVATEGNLSRAARSLAPPGYSHHGSGDFDVGAASLGEENFTEQFASTEEYRRLMDLGYVEIRYGQANQFGVRHEPWHIRVS